MALQTAYEKFLASPNESSFTEKASFSYVPTLTTLKEPDAILKHIEQQNKSVVKTKTQKVISAIEGHNALALDVDTTLEFISGGGAYLPGLDNFVVDKIATFPVTHIVAFDDAQRIKQIRISWDQGSLLKQVGIIGSSGRNWPICDGKDQARLIAGASVGTVLDNATDRGREIEQTPVTRRNESPRKKHIADPYGSLANTGFAHPEEERIMSPSPNVPRASAKPPPRDMGDLFVSHDEDSNGARPSSPLKENQPLPPKGGGADNRRFQASRLFEPSVPESPAAPKGATNNRYQGSRLFDLAPVEEKAAPRYKSDPNKYSHFQHGDAEDGEVEAGKDSRPVPMRPSSRKNQSQLNFDDAPEPAKPAGKARSQEERHYHWSDDEGELAESPGRHPHVAHPRRDADSHINFAQEATPAANKTRPTSRGNKTNTGHGLYQNHIYDDGDGNGEPEEEIKQPLANVTNINNRKKDFDGSWMANDDTPVKTNDENKPRTINEMKHNKALSSHWQNFDESPEEVKQRKNDENKPHTINEIRHNNALSSHWQNFDDESADQVKQRTNDENKPHTINGIKHNNALSSHWQNFDESPEQVKPKPAQNRGGNDRHWGPDQSPEQTKPKPAQNRGGNDRSWGYDQSPETIKTENQKPAPHQNRGGNDRSWGFDDEGATGSNKPAAAKQTSAGGGARNFWDF